jgi:hypothetical protein
MDDELMDNQTDLPPELQEIVEAMRANRAAKIEEVGKEVAKKRDEAVAGRKASGIERIWDEDEEYYHGIDDANRDNHPMVKSASTSGGISRGSNSNNEPRCQAFFNITAQFVDSAAARIGDILLPAGDWSFSVKASPLQDDVRADLLPGLGGPPQPGQPQEIQTDANAQDPRQLEAEAKAKKGEVYIQDKLVECSYHTEVRKVIDDAARLGTGVLKGPFPEKRTKRKAVLRNGSYTLELVSSVNPVSKHVDPRDFFPDPACGDNIHNGSYTVERDRFTAKQLLELKGTPGYISEQIDLVLDQGPDKKNYDNGLRVSGEQTADADTFTVWYFHGLIDVVCLSAMGNKLTDQESAKKYLPAIVTLVNETAIKASIDPLDSGEFPYDVMVWQAVAGTWTGKGVARQGRTAQDQVNASGRALMDNAGLSSGPMVIIRKNAIVPANGKWEITPRKVWWATAEADTGRSMADVFTTINIPTMQAELDAIMTRGEKMMETATGVSSLLMGQQGSATDTVEGMKLLHQNASALLRRLARVFDERVTEPQMGRYYEYLLLHGPDEAKGDMNIEAIGSSALVEREIQAMEAMVLLQLSANPAFGLDPEKAMAEVLKTKRFIVDKWVMDEAKKKQLPPPMVPAIEVAKIRSQDEQARLALEKDKIIANNTLKKHSIDVDTDRDTVYNDHLAARDEMAANIRMQELQIKRELAMLDYANRRNISLDAVKAGLAKEAMKLRVQKELTGVAQVAEPIVEPPGRATDGNAFTE